MEGFERGGSDSKHWHQGQGAYAGYRFYSDVSVDNFNAVLYGYTIYFDLAADAEQKKIIAHAAAIGKERMRPAQKVFPHAGKHAHREPWRTPRLLTKRAPLGGDSETHTLECQSDST